MEDIDIYNLAGDIISSIASDLNNGIYSDMKGSLSVFWQEDNKFNAWARSDSNVDQPPIHIVGMYYELARQLYRDIDQYCDYIEGEYDKTVFNELFKDDPKYVNILPSCFSKADYRKNMLISGLTWVFFHEVGHLNQEHGHIRNQLSENHSIHECDIDNSNILSGKASAIYHVTEIAADFEAVNICIQELLRHFKGIELEGAVSLFIGGLSCVMYRFHGVKSLQLNPEPTGSHPIPLVRLENILSQIWEILDLSEFRRISEINLNRSKLVHMCNRSATTVGLFWLRRHSEQPEIPSGFFLERTLNKLGGKSYMQTIINTWDEIEPTIRKNKRYGHPLTVLRFSEQYRKLVFESTAD